MIIKIMIIHKYNWIHKWWIFHILFLVEGITIEWKTRSSFVTFRRLRWRACWYGFLRFVSKTNMFPRPFSIGSIHWLSRSFQDAMHIIRYHIPEKWFCQYSCIKLDLFFIRSIFFFDISWWNFHRIPTIHHDFMLEMHHIHRVFFWRRGIAVLPEHLGGAQWTLSQELSGRRDVHRFFPGIPSGVIKHG